MTCCIIRKVVFRSGIGSRIEWGFVLIERQGLALLLVPRHGAQCHRLAFCQENVESHEFELVDLCMFPLQDKDLQKVGEKLRFLGENFEAEELQEMIKPENLESI